MPLLPLRQVPWTLWLSVAGLLALLRQRTSQVQASQSRSWSDARRRPRSKCSAHTSTCSTGVASSGRTATTSPPPSGSVVSSNNSVENEVARTSASWLQGGFPAAPNHASGCPKRRPASASKPLGPRRPAIPAVSSTQVNKGYTITRAWPDGKGAVDVKPMLAGEATAAAIWVPRATLLDVFATAAASAGADLRYGTAVCRKQAGSACGQAGSPKAPVSAGSCLRLLGASASHGESAGGPRWPAVSGFVST